MGGETEHPNWVPIAVPMAHMPQLAESYTYLPSGVHAPHTPTTTPHHHPPTFSPPSHATMAANKRSAEGTPATTSPSVGKKQRPAAPLAPLPSLTEQHPGPGAKAAADAMSVAWGGDADGARGYLGYTHAWLWTDDMGATVEFYVRKLGFQLIFRYADLWCVRVWWVVACAVRAAWYYLGHSAAWCMGR